MPSQSEERVEAELRPDDLLVKSLAVQGGEAEIAGEPTRFARIVLTGVELRHATEGRTHTRHECAVLKIEDAAAFATELGVLVDEMVRATRTPTVRSTGTWSWLGSPPHGDDLFVTRATVGQTSLPFASGLRPTVRIDLEGGPVHAVGSGGHQHLRGAVFSSPRQVQALTSSLKKIVFSAFSQQRLDVYVARDEPLTAFGF